VKRLVLCCVGCACQAVQTLSCGFSHVHYLTCLTSVCRVTVLGVSMPIEQHTNLSAAVSS
jgi:hypothetical protein